MFPQKWELADPLPVGQKESLIRDLLLYANEKAVDITHLSFAVDTPNRDIELLRLREILWRVEDRLRPELENKFKEKPHDIRANLIKETLVIYQQKDQVTKNLKNEMGLNDYQSERLAFQALLYKAQCGQELSQVRLFEMKNILTNSTSLLPIYDANTHSSTEIHNLAADKTLYLICSDQKNKTFALNKTSETFEMEVSRTRQLIQKQLEAQIANHLVKSKSSDFSI